MDDHRTSIRRTYTVTEVAAMLGISRTTAYECIRTGELPSLRFRRRIVVPAIALHALIERSDNARQASAVEE